MKLSISDSVQQDSKQRLQTLIEAEFATKLASKDFTLWGEASEAEASIRLGWVDPIQDATELLPEILKLKQDFKEAGLTRVVLCGMGGSSLAPEVICKNAGVDLHILDSTSPTSVRKALQDLQSTVVVVSSKSGSTVETDSQRRIFEQQFSEHGIDPKNRMVIVTDPGSALAEDSYAKGYRVFEADPTVGGRYSALTAFGLVPSGLAGANITQLIADAKNFHPTAFENSSENPALHLAAAMSGSNSRLVIDDSQTELAGIADWIEQLIAESTGKEGLGILPVSGDPEAELAAGASSILPLRFSSDPADDGWVTVEGNLAEMFLTFEVATAAAGMLLGINPFDQPDVESAKIAARESLEKPQTEPQSSTNIEIKEALAAIESHGYLAIQIYANRGQQSELISLREKLVSQTRVPVTVGWGPRFLHSTGQFHKGGTPGGVFLQIIQHDQELMVPGKDYGFQQLLLSQADGDARVLSGKGNKVLKLIVGEKESVIAALETVID